MGGDLTALQALWGTYPVTMPTSAKLVQVNGKMVPGPAKDISRGAIKSILKGYGAYDAMQAYVVSAGATQPCLTATNYLLALVTTEAAAVGDVLKTSNPANLAYIEELAGSVLADPANGMTQAVLDNIMALITPPILWWQARGFDGPVLVSDLIAAGNLY